jgi:hypothetical protein
MKATAAAEPESPVITIRNAAAGAKINVHNLRRNVSVLEGSGGNITVITGRDDKGMIRAAEANVANTNDETIVIPGHGPIGNKSQLIEFRDMFVAIREKVADLKKQGKSLEEAVAAKPTADFDEKWGRFVVDGNFFTRLVYAGV